MTLLYPIWLILAVPLAVTLLLWPLPGRLLRLLRGTSLLLILLALCGLALKLPSRAGTVVVVADRSESMPPGSDALHTEAIRFVQKAMSAEDRLAVVSFGRTTVIERGPQAGEFNGFLHEVPRDASDLAGAVETALSLIPKDAPGRILILSDGRWTGRDPAAVASRAAAREIALDYRPLERSRAGDLAVARVDAPAAVASGASFLITAWVQAPSGQEVTYELKRGNTLVSRGKQRVVAGLNRLTFRDRAAQAGTQGYTLTVTGTGDDPVPDNNVARLLVGVRGPRPLLHVTSAADSGLARLLRAGGLTLEVRKPAACRWTLEELSRYSAVLLENVPAEQIGVPGMETLAAWVRATGSGLMLTGGRQSYGPGGYYRSPLEAVLPVSLELRNEHRKLALSIVVALDRSGSMAMPIRGGRVKMDLANAGTAQVIDLLGPMDEIGVLAVDTVAHTVAPLGRVSDKAALRSKVLGIQSMGGGIFVYEALVNAVKMMVDAKSATRHIILFADAADAVEPGDYKELLRKCQAAGITVSAIGLGTERDKDAGLLKDIARRGKGRCFFTDKPEDLPRLFAQDTFVVARSTFIDEATPVKATAGLGTLTGRDWKLAPSVGGYNLCYLRREANLAAVTLDEYKAPLVASWQAGAGRVLCYTGEADGKYAGAMARWQGVGAFYTSLARWVSGQSGPLSDNMQVTQEVKKGVNLVQLHLDPERKRELVTSPPKVTVLRGPEGRAPKQSELVMHWTGLDTLVVELPLHGSETALATVLIPGQDPVSLPPVCLPYSPEFQPPLASEGTAALERLGRATGGKERVELASIWKDLPRRPRLIAVGHWLLLAAVVLLLLEVLERRTGLLTRPRRLSRSVTAETATQPAPRRRWFSWRKKPRPVPELPPLPPALPAATELAQPAAPPPPLAAEESVGMVDALRQARQRSRSRME